MHRSRPGRVACSLVLLLLVIGAGALAGPAVAGAQEPTARLRIGHLSPSTPGVDVTIAGPDDETAPEQPVTTGTAYGGITQYLSLAPGRYVVRVRPTGTDPAAPAAVSTGVDVGAVAAQTLLFFDTGPGGTVRGKLVSDELGPTPPATGRVRTVQGAVGLPPVDVLPVNGPRLAAGLEYGTISEYTLVPATTWDIRISAGGQTVSVPLPVGPGSVTTMMVTRNGSGSLTATPIVDVPALGPPGPPLGATGSAPGAGPRQPVGGVPAGGGGQATPGIGLLPVVVALACAPLLALAISYARGRSSAGPSSRSRKPSNPPGRPC